MRTLIYLAALTLTTISFNPVAYKNSLIAAVKFPNIVSSVQFPATKVRKFRHTIRLEIPAGSSSLSQLNVEVPNGLTVKNNISVFDHYGRKINTNVSINENKIIIAFPQPIASPTRLNIEMNNIERTGTSRVWLYPISARFVEINADIPIGVAQIRVY